MDFCTWHRHQFSLRSKIGWRRLLGLPLHHSSLWKSSVGLWRYNGAWNNRPIFGFSGWKNFLVKILCYIPAFPELITSCSGAAHATSQAQPKCRWWIRYRCGWCLVWFYFQVSCSPQLADTTDHSRNVMHPGQPLLFCRNCLLRYQMLCPVKYKCCHVLLLCTTISNNNVRMNSNVASFLIHFRCQLLCQCA